MSSTIKFNAGKVDFEETTLKCTPNKQKGVITIKASEDDPDFYVLSWLPKDAAAGENEELLLIPGDVTFKKITLCKTGRVFQLSFLLSLAKHFFWFQDIGELDDSLEWTEEDNILLARMCELVDEDEDDEEEEGEEEETKGNGEPQRSTHELTKPTLMEIDDSTQNTSLPVQSLADVLSVQQVNKLLERLTTEEIRDTFGPLLPPLLGKDSSKEGLIQAVRSGFFQQSVDRLSESLREGEGAGLLLAQSFGLDYKGEGIDNFLQALRDKDNNI